jgi:pimeloyl-ACP methyl ester carboxylesterase
MAAQHIARVSADGIDVFYRFAGCDTARAILLLHGYPSSSHQFRHLIPLLAQNYYVVAPDLPGFGFTEVPEARKYVYTFENLATTLEAFVEAVGLKRYAIYVFDYGAPTGLRLALRRPHEVTAIITQNGNAYEEGLGTDFWAPLRSYWKTGSSDERQTIGNKVLSLEATRWQYENGSPASHIIPPETYHLDQALLNRPGNRDIQLDLLYDYGSNVRLYPDFQQYFRDSNVPVLVAWGKNDVIFPPAGAKAFAKDVQKFEIHMIDAGHFALENKESEFAQMIHLFLSKHNSIP